MERNLHPIKEKPVMSSAHIESEFSDLPPLPWTEFGSNPNYGRRYNMLHRCDHGERETFEFENMLRYESENFGTIRIQMHTEGIHSSDGNEIWGQWFIKTADLKIYRVDGSFPVGSSFFDETWRMANLEAILMHTDSQLVAKASSFVADPIADVYLTRLKQYVRYCPGNEILVSTPKYYVVIHENGEVKYFENMNRYFPIDIFSNSTINWLGGFKSNPENDVYYHLPNNMGDIMGDVMPPLIVRRYHHGEYDEMEIVVS